MHPSSLRLENFDRLYDTAAAAAAVDHAAEQIIGNHFRAADQDVGMDVDDDVVPLSKIRLPVAVLCDDVDVAVVDVDVGREDVDPFSVAKMKRVSLRDVAVVADVVVDWIDDRLCWLYSPDGVGAVDDADASAACPLTEMWMS